MMYTLASGREPFQTAEEVLDAPIPWADHFDKHNIKISNEFKSLIDSIMKKEPTERLDLNQILQHAWFNHD